jgi:hypothetical protein
LHWLQRVDFDISQLWFPAFPYISLLLKTNTLKLEKGDKLQLQLKTPSCSPWKLLGNQGLISLNEPTARFEPFTELGINRFKPLKQKAFLKY